MSSPASRHGGNQLAPSPSAESSPVSGRGGGEEPESGGGGSPVGVEDVDLRPSRPLLASGRIDSEMPIDNDPGSLGEGEDSPVPSAGSSPGSSESMGGGGSGLSPVGGGGGGGGLGGGGGGGGGRRERGREESGGRLDDFDPLGEDGDGTVDDGGRLGTIPMELDQRRPPIHGTIPRPDLSIFERVRTGLAENSTVGWENAHVSIDLATRNYEMMESQRFLRDFLQQITGIMLDQVVGKIAHFEKTCAIRTLEMSCNVLPMLLRNGRAEFMETVVTLFDPSRALYNTSKTMWSTMPGIPELRVKLCQHFMQNGGFKGVATLLDQQTVRLQRQAKLRADAKATKENKARRAQLARAEAKQAKQNLDFLVTGANAGDLESAEAAVEKAVEAAVLATANSERASAAAAAACSTDAGEHWMGAESMAIILGAVAECRLEQPPTAIAVVVKICQAMMMQVAVLTEEELKKESQDALTNVVRHVRNLMVPLGEAQMKEVFGFHKDLILRNVRSASLPMRLWGWEQTEELIALSHKYRWNAKAYLVEGAGTQCCNGVYRVSPDVAENVPQSAYKSGRPRNAVSRLGVNVINTMDEEDAPKYTYQAKGGPLLTLFRCKMRTKAFWWFISEADPAAPGTDKDVDYYQHKSTASENFMPQRTGWEAAADNKAIIRGVDPPPTVTPCEGVLCPPNQERMCLEWDLANWVVRNKVVEEIFGDSIHREVVGRSAKLLRFLSSMEGALTTEHLDLIWRSCVGKAEPELQAVVYQLLTSLVECMKPELVCHLISRLQESADGAGKGGGRHEVLAFVEVLATNQGQVILTRNRNVCSAALQLLWSLLREPSVVRHKSCESVTNFFALMLRTSAPSVGTGGQAYWHQHMFLGQCINFLREKANCTPPDGSLSETEEAAVSRSLELVRFLLESFHPEHMGEVVQRYAFPERTATLQRQAQAKKQQEQLQKQHQHVSQREGEGTDQGRAREQPSGESAAGDDQSPSAGADKTSKDASASIAGETSSALGISSSSPALVGGDMKAGGVGGAMVMDENGDVEGDSITISTASSSGGEVGRGGEAEQEGLPVLLLRELASFKARFPSRVGKHLRSDAAEMVLKTQVRQRLDLIRYIHGLADGVNLSMAQLRGLWGILESPAERELCLAFLEEGASPQTPPMEHLRTAFGDEERVFLFRELICKEVDWTSLGLPAYSCFNAFFSSICIDSPTKGRYAGIDAGVAGAVTLSMPHPPNAAGVALDKIASVTPPLPPGVTVGGEPRAAVVPSAPSAPSPVEEEDLTALGIDTLWRVTLTSQNAEVAASATQDLLEVYNTPEMQRRTRASPANALDRTYSGGSVKSSSSSSYGKAPQVGGAAAVGPSIVASGRESSKKNRSSLYSFDSASTAGQGDSPFLAVVSSPQGHGQVFRDSIFSHLAEARKELEKLAEAKKASGSPGARDSGVRAGLEVEAGTLSVAGGNGRSVGEAEEEAVRVRLRRCLGLLQGVIRGAAGKMTPAHADRGMGLPWEVSISMVVKGPPKHAAPAGMSSTTAAGTASISSTSVVPGGGPAGALPSPPTSSKYVLEVHPMETVGSLRARVAVANGRGQAADNTRLVAGKPLQDDLRTCQEVNVTEGTTVVTLVTPSVVSSGTAWSQAMRHASDQEQRDTGPRHDGDVIAMQDEPFDELFRLLECAHGLQDHATTKAVLNLLMSLPTQCTLLQHVRETGLAAAAATAAAPAPDFAADESNGVGGPSAMDEDDHGDEAPFKEAETKLSEAFMATSAGAGGKGGESAGSGGAGVKVHASGEDRALGREEVGVVDMTEQWEELLPLGRNWHKTVYTLQIIDALLLPADAVLGAKCWSPETDAFRMGFLQGGGFARVLKVLMAAPTGDVNRDDVLGHASALRILKTCLFYPLLVGVGRTTVCPDESARPMRRRKVGAMGVGVFSWKAGDGKGAEEPPALVARALPKMTPPTVAARAAMNIPDSDLQRLLDRLVLVSLAAQRGWLKSQAVFVALNEDGNDSLARDKEEKEEQGPYRQVITDCLALVGTILSDHPPMMKALSENASAREFVVSTLSRNPAPRIRRQMGQLLVGARPIAGTLLRWLTGELEGLPLTHTDCDEFFSTMRDLVFANRDRCTTRVVTGTAAPTLSKESSSTPSAESSTTVTMTSSGDGEEMVVVSASSTPEVAEADQSVGEELDLHSLACVLSAKMMAMPRDGHGSCKAVLQGCLEVLADLVEIEGPDGSLLDGTELGQDLVEKLFKGFLFTMPEKRGRGMSVERPVCAERDTKIAALDLLAVAARKSPQAMSTLLENVDLIVGRVLPSLRHRWGYECSFDAKRNEQGRFVGLKNQGCTCYMNSLLQQLFMVPALRKAILAAKLPRRKLEDWPKELVGRRVALQWEAGGSSEAFVAGYNEQTGEHVIRYDMKEDICLRLGANGGRPGKETGAVSLVWGDSSSSARGGGEGKTMTPQEATALVLEQVQRTFVHLRDGERRFFDPIRLVEACRCLNLEYMVHQQNDASEFCDKLLDRLEMGMKAGQAAVAAAARTGGVLVSETGALDAYGGGNESGGVKPRVAALDRLFGGTWVHQKIPTGCSHRTNRLEPFINLEVNIRGKESIEESLASFVESELMAGDNKVDCEDCGEKKDARLRTCLDRLPNLLIIHLKRFELDYTIFETVKLNDRCSFPMVLDVKPYTMKGTDEREAMEEALRVAAEAAGGDLTIEQVNRLDDEAAKMEEDAGDYLYNLAGILVHAGVAQGGHYYSYIRDRGKSAYEDGDDSGEVVKETKNEVGANGTNGRGGGGSGGADVGAGGAGGKGTTENADGGKDAWYKFEDDEVTPFNPQDIEANCFGGTTLTTTTWNGVRNTVEHERTANALLLFYEKVRPREDLSEDDQISTDKTSNSDNSSINSGSTAVVTPVATAAAAAVEQHDSVEETRDSASLSVGSPSSSPMESSALPETVTGKTADTAMLSSASIIADNISTSTESDLDAAVNEKSAASRDGVGAGRRGVGNKVAREVGRAAAGKVIPLLDGVEAYSEEVWQANVQYMLNSYVFDPDFHKFLRDILASTVGAMDGGGVAPTSQGGAADLVNEWGNTPEEASLSARVLKMGMTQLLDVILHSREREDVKSWDALLRRALTSSPEMCKWFLESLLERQRPEGTVYWLRQITLECLDNMARHTATRLIAHACCCGANDPTERELLTAVDRTTGRALNSGRQSRSLVARVLASVSELTEEVGAFPRSSEELFLLVRDLAMGHEAVRRHLLGSEMAARLVIFVTRDHSPPEVINEFPNVMAQQSAHTDFVHLLEAVSAVIGAQRQPKADLLEEPTSSGGLSHSSSGHVQGSELTPLARNAFTEIFRRHSHNDAMDMRHMMDYMDSCGVAGKSKFDPESTLKNILAKYDTIDGRLSLKGFIQYYRDIAAQDPRQAWNDLYHMGYRSDLTAGPGYDDEVYGIAPNAKDSQRRPVLPELTTKALTCIEFYLTAAHVSTGVSMGAETETLILCRVAMDRPEDSHRLVSGCLQELYHLRPAWPADDSQERVLCSVLLNLLRIRDEAQMERIRHAFEERQMGLLEATKAALEGLNQHQRYNQYSPQSEKLWARYDKLWHAAHKIPAVRVWYESNEEAQALYPDPARSSRNRGAGAGGNLIQHRATGVRQSVPPGVDSGDDSDCNGGKGCDLLVEGAGCEEANGRYVRVGDVAAVPSFRQRNPVGKEAFIVFFCTSTRTWYMSKVLEGHGRTGSDAGYRPYYQAKAAPNASSIADVLPPNLEWRAVEGPARDTLGPTVYFDKSMETDDDNSDNDLSTDNNQVPPTLLGPGDDMMETGNSVLASPARDGTDALVAQVSIDSVQLEMQGLPRGNSVISTPSSSPTNSSRPVPPTGVPRSRGRARHASGPSTGSGGSDGGSSSAAI